MERSTIIENLKKDKFFKKGDIVIYIVLLLCIILLFYGFVIKDSNKELTQVNILDTTNKMNNVIFTYDFKKDQYESLSKDIEIEKDGSLIKVKVKDNDEFNIVVIEKTGKVYVEDANCSKRKDCVHTKAIIKGGDIIVCVPHNLMVEGVGNTNPDIVIG